MIPSDQLAGANFLRALLRLLLGDHRRVVLLTSRLDDHRARNKEPRMYEIHPAALVFPAITPNELFELAEDIKEHGQLMPIEIFEKKVIDGRHRQEACKMAGVTPDYVFLDDLGGRTPLEYVWSLNGTRRHLTTSQRAAIAAELREELLKKSEEVKKSNLKHVEPIESANLRFRENTGKTAKVAAEIVGVSSRSVDNASRVKKADPELFEEVKSGRKSLNKATEELHDRRCGPKPASCDAVESRAKAKVPELVKSLRLQLGHLGDTGRWDKAFDQMLEFAR